MTEADFHDFFQRTSGRSPFEFRTRVTHKKGIVTTLVAKAMLTLHCGECLEQITDPDYLKTPATRQGLILCQDCDDSHQQPCERCLEYWDEDSFPSNQGELIAIWRDVPANNLERTLAPGYYRVLRWPFFTQPMIGDGFMHANALERVMGLDELGLRAAKESEDFDGYPSGPLCPQCQVDLEFALGTVHRIPEGDGSNG